MIIGFKKEFDKPGFSVQKTGFYRKFMELEKSTTIRRGFHAMGMDTAHVYENVRQKGMKLLGELPIFGTWETLILFDDFHGITSRHHPLFFIGGKWLERPIDLEKLRQFEGFECVEDMVHWFWLATGKGKQLFIGTLISTVWDIPEFMTGTDYGFGRHTVNLNFGHWRAMYDDKNSRQLLKDKGFLEVARTNFLAGRAG